MSSMPWVCERCGNTNEQHERDWAMRQDERDAERQQGAKDEREAIVAMIKNVMSGAFRDHLLALIEGRGKKAGGTT